MDSGTQVIVGDFPESISAKDLALYLEARLGIVWRCRLKTTCTPHNACPIFSCSEIDDNRFPEGVKCLPHAFVHFASPQVAKEACKLSSKEMLRLSKHTLKVQLSNEAFGSIHSTSTKPGWKLPDVTVELGSLISPNELLVSWKGPSKGASFELEWSKKRYHLFLTMWTLFGSTERQTQDRTWMKCNYKLEFFTRDIWEVRKENEWDGEGLTFIIQSRVPPRIFYRTEDDDVYHATSFNLSDDADPWIRTLDFTPDKSIGRCLAYRISVSPRQKKTFQKILEYFAEQQLLKSGEQPRVKLPFEVKSRHQRWDFFLVPNERNLPFNIMFLVNGLIHKGIIKVSSLTPGFYDLLDPSVTDTELAMSALSHMYSYKTPVFNAERRLKSVIDWWRAKPVQALKQELQISKMEVRGVIITPTKAYCYSTEVELSNRVLRQYNAVRDRFLRVSFLDETFHPLSANMLQVVVTPFARTNGGASKNALYFRVRNILLKGFVLCERRYCFLAFSSNQLRDHSAWFFAPTEGVDEQTLRDWMGQFPRYNVARYAARMGQCFSSTFETVRFPLTEVKCVDDITRNGFTFSDGIGKITPALALDCAKVLNLDLNPPSAYQIRYAGYKGVVVNWPSEQANDRFLTLRRSMKKFISSHEIIEVVSWSKFLPGFLNRQIITLLSALQVQNRVFIEMQDSMLDQLNQLLDSAEVAFEVLSSYCSGDLHTTALEMLSAGFHPLCEPHLKSMLQCIRASYLEEVLRKARIFVKDGRWLMGCMDELGVLEYGECFVQVSSPEQEESLPQALIGSQRTNFKLKVITGPIIMAKNPCLHPGDIRVLKAVDNPALHHLVDCFIMPQKGDRPHSNEASGSDLDGDVYFVCWDPRLIPPSGQSWEPMQYQPSETKENGRLVDTKDVVDFFVRHMVNDHLGKICNAHVVHADRSPEGALNPNCLLLAEQAAIAVDAPKTGEKATLPPHLKPSIYPDFMDKDDWPSYRSEKILGILFRRIKGNVDKVIKEIGQLDMQEHHFYDPDLIVEGFESYISEAQNLKVVYDKRLIALMDQFDVKVEAEVVTGHVSTIFRKHSSRRRGDMKERIKSAYVALREEYKQIFNCEQLENIAGEEEDDILQEKLECKASAWYHVTYHPECAPKVPEDEVQESSKINLLSFPWIAVEILARIKLRKRRAYESYHKLIRSFGDSFQFGSY